MGCWERGTLFLPQVLFIDDLEEQDERQGIQEARAETPVWHFKGLYFFFSYSALLSLYIPQRFKTVNILPFILPSARLPLVPGSSNVKILGLTTCLSFRFSRDSLVAQMVKSLPVMWETWVQSLGWEDALEEAMEGALEKEMATHSNILAWKIPWTEESGRLQSIGWQRVGHD